MIKQVFITGDTHGLNSTRLYQIASDPRCADPAQTAIIILGDAGYNFYLNKTDIKNKKNTQGFYRVYCVRGNHEERPENLGYEIIFDEDIKGYVYLDPINETIRYLLDGGEYEVKGYSFLTIGGAYSVDKYYRLAKMAGRSWTGWFADEQLTPTERDNILEDIRGKKYDFVFTHTCPIAWEPTDLFLKSIDQSMVEKDMERWLGEVEYNIKWNIWCFGHYHADRVERPNVEQFYTDFEEIDSIWDKWNDGTLDEDTFQYIKEYFKDGIYY